MTHTYIHLPTKWGYTKFDSFTKPSGDISIVYTCQKQETLHHPSHAVGLQIRYFHDHYIKRYT